MANCEYDKEVINFITSLSKRIAHQIRHHENIFIDVGPFMQNGYNNQIITLVKITLARSTSIEYCIGLGFRGGHIRHFCSLDIVIDHINKVWFKNQTKELKLIKKRQKDIEILKNSLKEMNADYCDFISAALQNNHTKITGMMRKVLWSIFKDIDNDVSDKLFKFYIIGDTESKELFRSAINSSKNYNQFKRKIHGHQTFKILLVVLREDLNKFKLVFIKQRYFLDVNVSSWYVAKNIIRHLNNFALKHSDVSSILADPGAKLK